MTSGTGFDIIYLAVKQGDDTLTVKIYNKIPDEAKEIREEVFVKEQGFKSEFDKIDDTAVHFVLFDDKENAMAVCRVFSDSGQNEYHLGRLAVRKECRGRHLGEEILKEAEKYVKSQNGKAVLLSAQVRVSDFYIKQGYEKFGDVYYDEYCPHIMMKKIL